MTKRATKLVGTATKVLGPKIIEATPQVSGAAIHVALLRAISGYGPLPGAAEAAQKQHDEQHGDAERAIHEVIENNVLWATGGGLLTNLGGVITAAVAIPANITTLAIIQCRMVAGIAHLRGYDLSDPRVHNAIMATLLGEDRVKKRVKKKKLPAHPAEIATAPSYDPHLDVLVGAEVAAELFTRMAGKRAVGGTAKKVPIIGGIVGAVTDGIATYRVGRYAAREFVVPLKALPEPKTGRRALRAQAH